MLDIKKIKENPDAVKAGLRAKEVDCDATVDRILELDEQRRALIADTEARKARQNKVSKEIPQLKKQGKDVSGIFTEMAELKKGLAEDAEKLDACQAELRTAMLSLPNLPDPDLKPGGKENNEPLRYFGEPHKFDFEPKHHVDLCLGLGLIDYERGVKLAGTGNWMYTGMGARLEWALLNYFIDCHIADGYEFILPPHMLEYQCGETAGQFPKFADEVYKIANPRPDSLHAAHCRGGSVLYLPGRNPAGEHAAEKAVRLHPLLPPGGRFSPGRRAGHGPGPSVQQGGDVPVHPSRGLRRCL